MTVIPTTPAAVLDTATLPMAPIEALYVHVPFCFHKCHYCDFYSITRQSPERMNDFVDLILSEGRQWQAIRSINLQRPRTVFFGGGTPSLLPLEYMERLIRELGQIFDLSELDEWTVEVNPATASLEYCQMLRGCGVDRVSFGAQSFNIAELQTLERHHDPEDVPRSIDLARRAGFSRLNVDLIYGVPGQALSSWAASLDCAMELGTTHLSCYGLTYEPNTPMAVKKRLGKIRAIDESAELEMMRHTRRRLGEAGLGPYEISNYAVAGQECLHNLVYWTGGNYIGLGPSAASHLSGWRWRNRPHLGEWERTLQSHRLPAMDVESLSQSQRAGELAMLMLRLSGGLNFDVFAERIGRDARAIFSAPFNRLSELGLMRVDFDAARLTEAGIAVADTVSAEFLDLPDFPSVSIPSRSA